MHLLGGIMDSAGTGSHFHPIDHSSHRKKKQSIRATISVESRHFSHFQFSTGIQQFFFFTAENRVQPTRYSRQRPTNGSDRNEKLPLVFFKVVAWFFIWPRSWRPLKWALHGGRSNFIRAG